MICWKCFLEQEFQFSTSLVSCLIQKSQLVLRLLQLQSENTQCPWEVWFSHRKKKRNENAVSYKKQPKVQEKKRSFEYNTRNTAAPLSCKRGQPPFKDAIWPLLPFQSLCLLLLTRFIRCSSKIDPHTLQWKYLRLFPSDQPNSLIYYSDKPL